MGIPGDIGPYRPKFLGGCLTQSLAALAVGTGLALAVNGCEENSAKAPRTIPQTSYEATMDDEVIARSGPRANQTHKEENQNEPMDIIPEWMQREQEETERRKEAEKLAKTKK